MKKEIEVKLKFDDKNKVISKLKEINAVFRDKQELFDSYFSLKNDDMKNAHDLVRIRVKNGKGELTFKGKSENKSHIWERIELNTSVGDPKTMLEILNHLGFNKILEKYSEIIFSCCFINCSLSILKVYIKTFLSSIAFLQFHIRYKPHQIYQYQALSNALLNRNY